MTQKQQIYKCGICGNIVEVLHSGAGELVCCGKSMQLLAENMVDAATEKHVPVIIKTDKGIKIQVGQVVHPMDEKHFIEWIEIITENNENFKKFLEPGKRPEAEFCTDEKILQVRAFCNLHGLWKAKD